MALVYADRVKETTTTTGTGTVNLDGAETGFDGFVAGVGTTNTVHYCITDGTDWEVGLGTVTDATPDTLSRDSVYSSSNADALVSFAAGSKTVFATHAADDIAEKETHVNDSTIHFTTSSITYGTLDTNGDVGTTAGTLAIGDHTHAIYAPLASPTFTGTPSMPTGTVGITQTASDNSTKLATTAYADAAGGALGYQYGGTVTTAPVGSGEDAIVIGDGATAGTVAYAVCIGNGASAVGSSRGVAIGLSASVSLSRGVAIGETSVSSGSEAVAIGRTAEATGTYAVAIGRNADAKGTTSSVAVGYLANASAAGTNNIAIGPSSAATGNSTTAIGLSAASSGTESIAIGYGSSATATRSLAISRLATATVTGGVAIGYNSIVSSATALYGVGLGSYSYPTTYGEITLSSNGIATGKAKSSIITHYVQTTDATQTVLGTAIGNNDWTPLYRGIYTADDSTYNVDVDIVARRTDADNESAGYNLKGVFDRNTGVATLAVVGTLSKTVVAEDTAAWDVTMTANTTTGAIEIKVTGEAAKTINWVATIKMTTVTG